jgi:hypothetical protein
MFADMIRHKWRSRKLWSALSSASVVAVLGTAHAGTHRAALIAFSQREAATLPFNAASCADCHAVPALAGSSKITVVRAGRYIRDEYVPEGMEGIRHAHDDNVNISPRDISGLRVTLNLLGDGYVEAVPDSEIRALAVTEAARTHGAIHGYLPVVTLPERLSENKVGGRFGWKDQHGSLMSAAAEALRNELGVPSVYYPASSTAVPSAETPKAVTSRSGKDQILALVTFLRSTEPIGPDPQRSALPDVRAGSAIFDRIGCSICHISTLKTAPPGKKLEDGAAAPGKTASPLC